MTLRFRKRPLLLGTGVTQHGARAISLQRARLQRIGVVFVAVLLLGASLSWPVQAAVGFRSAGKGENATGATSLTINAPAGVLANDVLIAVLSIVGGTGTTINSVPTGWNIINSTDSTTVLKSSTYYKVATASEPTTYTFGLSTTAKAAGVIGAYSGVDVSASPIDAQGVQAYGSNTALTSPTINTTVPNTMVIAAFSTATAATLTAGSSMTLDANAQATSSGGGGAGTKRTAGQQYALQASQGATGTKTMTASAAAVNIGHTIALKPAPTISQVGFRFFANSTTSGAVGSALAAQDTAISTTIGQPIRLRMLLGVSGTQQTVGGSFKLQYKAVASGACDATGTFSDISTTTPIRWYDNTGTADPYSPLTTSGNDPFRSGVTVVPQTYKESNPFAVATAIPVGQDGMWDFALVMGASADVDSTYCLRATDSVGSVLTGTYNKVPGIGIQLPGSYLDGKDFKLYQNADNLAPGTMLAGANTAATLSSTGQAFRARMSLGKSVAFKSVSSGGDHTCAIASDNQAYCWGNNGLGQLGNNTSAIGQNGTYTQQPIPVPVDTTSAFSGKTILSISAGQYHTCAIASDNLAYCWGDTAYGKVGNGTNMFNNQPTPIAVTTSGVLSGKTISSISAGTDHTCVIASDNLAYCWGRDSGGQLGDNATIANQTTAVAVNTSGVLAGKTILSVSAGGTHTCAIASDNKAYCWGSDLSGQLGDSVALTNQPTPVAVDMTGALAGKTILKISAGSSHTCVIASDNKAYCWGDDTSGQLGDSVALTNQPTPVAVDASGVLSGKTILSISAGATHTCAIASDNKSYCWGQDINGQLGDNVTLTDQPTPVAVDTTGVLAGKTMLNISTGTYYSCAVASDNRAYCWGKDTNGQLGNDTALTQQATPVTVNTSSILSGKTFLSISPGAYHNCAIASDNNAYCWGNDGSGQLGNDPNLVLRPIPNPVDTSGVLSGKTILSISSGGSFSCAIASDNNAYCWGSDTNGELGNDTSLTNQPTPVAVNTAGVLAGKTIRSISAGLSHACVIASDNLAYCWGSDANGQLGDNTSLTNQPTPVAVNTAGVLAGKTILSISVGQYHTCVIASDNKAYCWGFDSSGQLGNDTSFIQQPTPVAVDTSGVLSGKTILSISARGNNTCAVASDNKAYCWGIDSYGQLGDNATIANQPTPVAVDMTGVLSGKTISSISTSLDNTCAIASDNLAYCWGADGNGQLGDNVTLTNQPTPVAVDMTGALSGKTISSISTGQDITCVIASDNLAYCWGADGSGQLGNDVNIAQQPLPVVVDNKVGVIRPTALSASKVSLALQFAQKTAVTCSVQTGFANVTGSSVIAFNDNASVANAASLSSATFDFISPDHRIGQTYHDAVGVITNPTALTDIQQGVWDFALKDNGASANTTYCLRLAIDDGTPLRAYDAYPEITTAGVSGPTIDQQLRGGQAVVNGTKSAFSF